MKRLWKSVVSCLMVGAMMVTSQAVLTLAETGGIENLLPADRSATDVISEDTQDKASSVAQDETIGAGLNGVSGAEQSVASGVGEAVSVLNGEGEYSLDDMEPDYVDRGAVNDTVSWSLDKTGVLRITGAGAMPDFAVESAPWFTYRERIMRLSLSSDLTRIGANAFADLARLSKIILPQHLESVGENAFKGCPNLTYIMVPFGILSFAENAVDDGIPVYYAGTQAEWETVSKKTDYVYCGVDALFIKGMIYVYSDKVSYTVTKMMEDDRYQIQAETFQAEKTAAEPLMLAGDASGDASTGLVATLEYYIDLGNASIQINGKGALPTFEDISGTVDSPWYPYRELIKHLELDSKVSGIADNSFKGLVNLETLSMNVPQVGKNAFADCGKLNTVIITSTKTDWRQKNPMFTWPAGVECSYIYLTLRFDANGGQLPQSTYVVENSAESLAYLARPTRKYYHFDGWFTSKDGGDRVGGVRVVENQLLYAHWSPEKYPITYVLNGGENPENTPMDYTYFSDDVTLPTPTRDGFSFNGWFKDEKLTIPLTKIVKGSSGAVKVYVAWKPFESDMERLGGNNRYNTAVRIAQEAFPEGAKEIVLVTGADFPDALAASSYAGAKNCPLLITKPASLSPQIKTLLQTVWKDKVEKVTIVGLGISEDVKKTLVSECGIEEKNIDTIGGKNRYQTANNLYTRGKKDGLFTTDAVVVVTGMSAADALSVSPWTYKYKMPILLCKSSGELSDAAKALVGEFSKIYIVGGENAVNDSTINAIKEADEKRVERISGPNRYRTSAAVAEKFSTPEDTKTFILATGAKDDSGKDKFADALGGAMLGGRLSSPVILVSEKANQNVPSQTFLHDFYGRHKPAQYYVLGGTAAVSDEVAASYK